MHDVLTDEILATKAKEGDTAAFEELFERHKDRVLNFVYRLIGNRETAKEVTQDVFFRVYRNLDIFDPEKRFSTWLYTIARNMAKNSLRDKKYFRDVSLEETVADKGGAIKLEDVLADPGRTPDEIAENDEIEDAMQGALDSLPLRFKEALTMHYVMGMPKEEVARVLKRSVITIKWRLKKGKKLLMTKLGGSSRSQRGDPV